MDGGASSDVDGSIPFNPGSFDLGEHTLLALRTLDNKDAPPPLHISFPVIDQSNPVNNPQNIELGPVGEPNPGLMKNCDKRGNNRL